jgi:Anti-sigma-K factor rskA
MKCEYVQPHIEAYAIGALSFEETATLKKHVDSCQACRTLLERYDTTLESLALEAGSFNSIFEPLEGHKDRFKDRLQARKQLRPGSKTTDELSEEAPPVPQRPKPRKRGVPVWGWLGGVSAVFFMISLITGIWALSLQTELNNLRNQNTVLAQQIGVSDQQKRELETLKQQNQQILNEKLEISQKYEALSQDTTQLRRETVSLQNTMLLLSNPLVTTHETVSSSMRLKVVMAPDERRVAILTHSFPKLNTGEIYYIWLHKGDNPIPIGELDLIALPEPLVAEALLIAPETMANYNGFSVTIQTKGTTIPNQRGREIMRDTL